MRQDHPTAALDATLVPARLEGPVGVFVDGENLQCWAAERIKLLLGNDPALRLCRVYGNYEHLNGWRIVPGFEVVYTGVPGTGGETVKNAADIKIAVDAMEFALREGGRTVVLCSSDRDFTPLVWALRRLGLHVVGAGEAKAAESFRASCNAFEVVPSLEKASGLCVVSPTPAPARPQTDIDKRIFTTAERLGARGKGARISDFNSEMRKDSPFNISSLPVPADRQWRKYFVNRPETYRVDPKGPAARVHIVKNDGAKN